MSMLIAKFDLSRATSDALAFLNALTEPHAEGEADSLAHVEGELEALVDLDCMTDLLNDCANGNDSACEELNTVEPVPCIKN